MIYVVQMELPAGIEGPVKIGFTASEDATDRINGLQTASPYPLRLLCTIPNGTRDAEGLLHRLLTDCRLCGEWFVYSDAVKDILRNAHRLTSALTSDGGTLHKEVPRTVKRRPNSLAAFKLWHRARTLDGLAKARERGRFGGRRRVVFDQQTVAQVVELRSTDLSFRTIAAHLGITKSLAFRMFTSSIQDTVS